MDPIWSNRIYIFSWCHLSMWSVQLQKSHSEAMLWLQSFLYPWDPAVALQFTFMLIEYDRVTFIFTPPLQGLLATRKSYTSQGYVSLGKNRRDLKNLADDLIGIPSLKLLTDHLGELRQNTAMEIHQGWWDSVKFMGWNNINMNNRGHLVGNFMYTWYQIQTHSAQFPPFKFFFWGYESWKQNKTPERGVVLSKLSAEKKLPLKISQYSLGSPSPSFWVNRCFFSIELSTKRKIKVQNVKVEDHSM